MIPDFKLFLFCTALDFLGMLNTKLMKSLPSKRLRKAWIGVSLVVIQLRHAHKWPSGLDSLDLFGSCPCPSIYLPFLALLRIKIEKQ